MCPMIVDRGANVTVVRPDVLSKQTLSRLRATNNVLKTATGETAKVCGKLRLWVRIVGTQVLHEVLVANIYDRFILGLDFLMAHSFTVDSGAGSLRIWAEEVALHKPLPSEQARCYRVTAVEDTLILPHSEAIVAAKIMANALCKPWGTIGPSMTAIFPPDVMVGKTLNDGQKDYVPVRVVNLSGEPRKVCSGTEVARLWTCEKDHEKKAFTVGNGLSQYNVMAFGLCNAPATFKRLMHTILGDLRCFIYLDDIIVHATVSIKHGLRTADCGLRTADHGLRTGYKIRTRYKMQTPDWV